MAVVRKRYGIPDNTFERIRKKVRERSSEEPIGKTMVEHGIQYVTEKDGSALRAFFSKDTVNGDFQTPT